MFGNGKYQMGEEYQNTFSRVAGNDARMGYFPTHPECVRMIASHLIFPESYNALDPCCGEGQALKELTKDAPGGDLFGIELDEGRAKEARELGLEVIQGDALTDAIVSQNSFGLMMLNPPYGTNSDGDREELLFLQKEVNYICKNGIIVYVVPEYIVDARLLRLIISRFSMEAIYRFPEYEYKKYKQVAFILRRSSNKTPLKQEVEEAENAFKTGVKPLEYASTPTYAIPLQDKNVLKVFTTKVYNEEGALLRATEVVGSLKDCFLADFLQMDDYTHIDVGQPLKELPLDHKMLMLASGVVHGTIAEGTECEHMQRGRVQIVEEIDGAEVEEDDFGELNSESGDRVVVTSRSKVTMTVLERDGTITHLM